MKTIAQDVECRIGAAWFKVLTSFPFTYSGFSIRHLAENCNQLKAYNIVYRLQSITAHASDPFRYVDVNDADKTFTANIAGVDAEELRRVLQLSSGLMCQLCLDLAASFQLASRSKLESFLPQISALDPT